MLEDGWYEGNNGTIHYVENELVICRASNQVHADRKWRPEDLIDNLTCTHCARKKIG